MDNGWQAMDSAATPARPVTQHRLAKNRGRCHRRPRSPVMPLPAIHPVYHDAQPDSAVRALHALDAHLDASPPWLVAKVAPRGVVLQSDHCRSPLFTKSPVIQGATLL